VVQWGREPERNKSEEDRLLPGGSGPLLRGGCWTLNKVSSIKEGRGVWKERRGKGRFSDLGTGKTFRWKKSANGRERKRRNKKTALRVTINLDT